MPEALETLRARLQECYDIFAASAVLSWDQSTYMPPGGGPARGRQMALLRRLGHERYTAPEIGDLIAAAETATAGAPYDDDGASFVRLARRDYDRLAKVPADLVAETSAHAARTYNAWTRARPANDFAAVRDDLKRTLELSLRYAACFPEHAHPADALIEGSDYGMTVATVRAVFEPLRPALVALIGQIRDARPVDDAPLHRHYPEDKQLAFARAVVTDLGYDFERGRMDLTPHPFMTKFSSGDVRITTRVRDDDLGDALFSMIHEAGHALYEQGINPSYEASPLGRGASSGAHESQSRLWENIVGRSGEFWQHYYPRLQRAFPGTLDDVAEQDFVRAINVVHPSLIRTDADEVTYNLHVMIRFDLELALLEGKLSVDDLPEAWRARYAADLGVTPPDDRDGVLQDVHWFGGMIGGAFQGYTLGNVMGAQFYEAALAAEPEIPADIATGSFGRLHGWLTENMYRHGRKFTAGELLERVTGRPLTVDPYLRYLRTKYGALYGLPPA